MGDLTKNQQEQVDMESEQIMQTAGTGTEPFTVWSFIKFTLFMLSICFMILPVGPLCVIVALTLARLLDIVNEPLDELTVNMLALICSLPWVVASILVYLRQLSLELQSRKSK